MHNTNWLPLVLLLQIVASLPAAEPAPVYPDHMRLLVYRDAADGWTSDAAAVRAIEIALVGVTEYPIHRRDPRQPLVDSLVLTTRVAPRNGLRP